MRVGTHQARGMDTPPTSFATKRSSQQHAGRHPPSPGDGYPTNKLRHEEVVTTARGFWPPPSPGDGYPANTFRHEEVRHNSTRVGTRQARGMDTPPRGRHNSTWVRQARGMDTPPTGFATKRCSQQHAGRHPPSPGDGYPANKLRHEEIVTTARG